ncbi:MAG: mechanosensitive ion channel family protein [Firmicutes bacterium]|nr:mechanosensitive ion channel family protein [Bacillota bacterium]
MLDSIQNILNYGIGSLTVGGLLRVLLTLALCAVVVRILNTIIGKMLDRSTKIDKTVSGFIRTGAKILLWALVIIIVADTLGIETTSLVALLSVVTLALSLSIQNILSNLFSGITLLVTKPLGVGDYVDISDKAGTVKNVGLFYTTLNTPDNIVINIPNADVTAASVKNYSKESERRVDFTFTASYNSQTEDVKAAIIDAINADEHILLTPSPMVRLTAYNASDIEYTVRVWCKSENYWDVKFNMNERVRETFKDHGVEMAYNQMDVHICKD